MAGKLPVDPRWVLVAIVVVCVATLAAVAFVIAVGQPFYIHEILAFVAPVLAGLLALKIEMVRRELAAALNGQKRDLRQHLEDDKAAFDDLRERLRALGQNPNRQ